MADTSNLRRADTATPVRFITWNVKGMNNPNKRSKVYSHLRHLRAEIIFLQETHLRVADQTRRRKSWIGQVFHSSFNSKARGVAILIDKKMQFSATNVISDPQGRYVIVVGTLFNTPVLLVNVYAPNFDDVEFANRLLSSLPDLNTHLMIFGGDLNTVINPTLDRSSIRSITPSSMSRAFSLFMDQNGYVDPWRFNNPNVKEFSFFSHVHHSFSRIDYFFIDKTFLPTVISSDYLAIVISDHAPLALDLSFAIPRGDPPQWRLNSLLLSDESFCNHITTSIDSFINTNTNDSVSHSLLWETLKAFLRGQVISFSAYKNKTQKTAVTSLLNSILDLDRAYSSNPTPELYKKRLNLQAEFYLLSTKKAEQLLLHMRGSLYEYGDKASRLLAHQLKQRAASRMIPQIRDSSGNLLSNPSDVNLVFRSFYSSLYQSELTDTVDIDSFFHNLDIPLISPDSACALDAPIKLEEIVQAIKDMQSSKAPGPDGYPTEFFKKFCEKLAPLLLNVFNESIERGSLPVTLTQASISLLLKKGKDPANCSSYRPISLLNVDVKILAKVLASRLETVLPSIVSEDQTGFVKGRHSFSNIRSLLNIIYSKQISKLPEAVISLDAEKAFDRVEWRYLFTVLRKFGFGERFCAFIRLLYSSPEACVCTNNNRSTYFPLSRGTRQGCPMSPLLFALAIEPLSIALKSSSAFSGIRREGTEYKVALYADDLLLYCTDPVVGIPGVLSILEDFGYISGYKLNIQKSEFFPVNAAALQIQQVHIPFTLSKSGFKYLGINITRSLDSLFKANLTPLLSQMKLDFQRWNNLPLSLVGRIQCVKMNMLPKFLYFFQCLPIFIPKSFFRSINQAISAFIWVNKVPRISRTVLQGNRCLGGLALPNFLYYYWAANLQKLTFWMHAPQTNWCLLEARSCLSTSLPALLCSSLPLSPSRHSPNPIVLSTFKIWNQFRRHFKFMTPSVLAPLSNNHMFPPSLIDSAFLRWDKKGIKSISDLYESDVFSCFQGLRDRYALSGNDLFRYFQIRHFVQAKFPSFPYAPPKLAWEKCLQILPNQRGIISQIYNHLMTLNAHTLSKTKSSWETELGSELTDEFWEVAVNRIYSSTSCARLGLIQFKVLHRVHFSKARLAEIYPNVDNRCDRCNNTPADLSHMFCLCPKLQNFWTSVFVTLSKILGINLKFCSRIALFGVPEDCATLRTTRQADIVAFASLLARRRILLEWKSPNPPSSALWLKDMMFFLKLEKIKFTLRGSVEKFYKKWQCLIDYFNSLQTLPSE